MTQSNVGAMVSYLLDFKDLEPLLNSIQVVDYDSLEEAISNVVVSMREIIADHIRHGKILTMTSVVIQDEGQITLAEMKVKDIVRELLAAFGTSSERL